MIYIIVFLINLIINNDVTRFYNWNIDQLENLQETFESINNNKTCDISNIFPFSPSLIYHIIYQVIMRKHISDF